MLCRQYSLRNGHWTERVILYLLNEQPDTDNNAYTLAQKLKCFNARIFKPFVVYRACKQGSLFSNYVVVFKRMFHIILPPFLFIRSLCSLCFLETTSPILMEYGTDFKHLC